MLRTGTQPIDGCPVRLRTISFVAAEPVLRIESVKLMHHPITIHFGNNGCRADRRDPSVAADNSAAVDLMLSKNELRQPVAVHLYPDRHYPQTKNCATHGKTGGLEDIQSIDFMTIGPCDRPCDCVPFDLTREIFTTHFGERFRIVKAVDRSVGVQDNCTGNDRPSQRAASCFVDTGDRPFWLNEQATLHGRWPYR